MKQSEDQITREGKSSSISCACAKCDLTVADGRATNYIRCGCSDCRTAFTWGHSNGGSEPDFLPHLYYMRSDILDVKGRDNLAAYKLRADGRSIRVYCNSCFSFIGADHTVYQNIVFMISPKDCRTDCDLSIRLTAHLFMSEYPLDYPDPTTDALLFHSFRFEQERKRFFALSVVQEAFREPEKAPAGETFRELLETLDKPTILYI